MPIRNGKFVEWKHTVYGIKKLFNDDTSDEYAKEVGKKIYKICNTKLFEDFDLLDCFPEIEDVHDLNFHLNELYNYADENLIWIN